MIVRRTEDQETTMPPGDPAVIWDPAASEQSFAAVGDRFIEATRRWHRSARHMRAETALYRVGETDLTIGQVRALEVLCSCPEWRMREIAAELGVDPSTATRTMAPLVDLALAGRRTDPGDRRNIIVAATAEGRAVAARIVEDRRTMMRAVLADMAPERRVLFTELLEQYLDALEKTTSELRRPRARR
jgi:DNA-binding MarR family transcriptional regulator